MGQGKSKSKGSKSAPETTTLPSSVTDKAKSGPTTWESLTYGQRAQFDEAWQAFAGSKTSITTKEMHKLFVDAAGVDDETANLLVRSYDLNGDGTIEVSEFRAFMAIGLSGTVEEKLRMSFTAFDTNGDGKLTRAELKPKIASVIALKNGSKVATDEFVDQLFDLIDTDKNGSIDIEEFVKGFATNIEVIQLLTT